MTEKRYVADASWAIAGRLSPEVLEKVGRDLPDWIQEYGYCVETGKDGFAALLVFGGPADEGEYHAAKLARPGPVYALDFDDEAPSILEFKGTRRKYLKVHPLDFLEWRGFEIFRPDAFIMLPTAGVVEGITLAAARGMYPKFADRFAEHPRGVLVFGDSACDISIDLSIRRKLRAYTVFYDPRDGEFSCVVSEADGRHKHFSTGAPSPNFPPVDSVLGETTMDGILQALQIPRELLQ